MTGVTSMRFTNPASRALFTLRYCDSCYSCHVPKLNSLTPSVNSSLAKRGCLYMIHHAQIMQANLATTGMQMRKTSKIHLGEVLIQHNLISEEQLRVALDTQKRSGQRLGRVFVESGFVTEEKIAEALSWQLNIPYIDLKFYDVNLELARKLPEARARRFRALVLEERGPALLVALADPTDISGWNAKYQLKPIRLSASKSRFPSPFPQQRQCWGRTRNSPSGASISTADPR